MACAISSPIEYINSKYASGEWDITKQTTQIFDEYERVASASSSSIPYLDKENVYTHKIASYSLVRYQCVVQDVFDPQFFVGAYAETDLCSNTRRLVPHQYRDDIDPLPNIAIDLDGPDCVMFERQPLFCIPIPCETAWAKSCQSRHHLKKRFIESSTDHALEAEQRRQAYEFEDGVPAIVKIYSPSQPSKLNTMLEIVGIYTPAPNEVDPMDDQDILPMPCPHAPTIHALYYRVLPATHPVSVSHALTGQSPLSVLTAIMNSELIAQYILCTLVSSVYERYESMPLGNMSLNISGLDCDDVRINQLMQFLKCFLPRVAQLDVTTASLNGRPAYAYKDASTERIWPSPLMLPSSSLLVINETNLSDGQLNAIGARSADAIMRLISSQQLVVAYDYFSVQIPLDIPVIILSKAPSIFRAATHIHAIPVVSPGALPTVDACALRQYWAAAISRSMALHSSALPHIEDDFLKLRSEHEIDESTFHQWLVLARLIAVSEESSDIMIHHWEKMKILEKARKEHNRRHFPSPCETPPPHAAASRSPVTTIHPSATPFPTEF